MLYAIGILLYLQMPDKDAVGSPVYYAVLAYSEASTAC